MFYIYRLKDEDAESHVVCKKFYLATIGCGETSGIVATAKRSPNKLVPTPDKRGSKKLEVNETHICIDNHIKSFNPCISHYRREHAPNRLYLPHEMTITEMHTDYLDKNPDRQITYTTYMRRVQNLNISFAKLGEEECERCEMLKQKPHQKEEGTCIDTCETCAEALTHKLHTTEARTAYKEDGENIIPGRIVRSIDLQKVIMLPRLPGFKSACFTRRLVGFHHTFAPVGSYCKDNKVISVVWHEGVSGRKCEDMASSVQLAIKADRYATELLYYMDNCSGQNKNYALYTSLLAAVNDPKLGVEKITLKFLEAGHTFMSADQCHAKVEKAMKKMVNVYDFDDFVHCIASTKAVVTTPLPADFKSYTGQMSAAKLKKLRPLKMCDMKVAEFRKGSKIVYYKKRHSNVEFLEFDYLLAKANLQTPEGRQVPRGISSTKQKDIVKNLVPLMPDSRKDFWLNLPIAEVNDLIDSDE